MLEKGTRLIYSKHRLAPLANMKLSVLLNSRFHKFPQLKHTLLIASL